MNQLQYIDEFKTVLASYRLSPEAQDLLKHLKLALLVGPSSSGRNTIISELVKSGAYHYIVSDTTRLPRVNNGIPEQNGREYWFRNEADLLHDLQAGQFLEAAVIHEQQVSGMSMRELATAAKEGKVAINEIEVVGADNIYAAKPDTQFFFVLPPSFDEWMVRMSIRGQLPPAEMHRRLTSAVDELAISLDRDYYTYVVNDTFMHTARRLDDMIINNAPPTSQEQQHGQQVARELLAETQDYLANHPVL